MKKRAGGATGYLKDKGVALEAFTFAAGGGEES
jgi:hypothetical protein